MELDLEIWDNGILFYFIYLQIWMMVQGFDFKRLILGISLIVWFYPLNGGNKFNIFFDLNTYKFLVGHVFFRPPVFRVFCNLVKNPMKPYL